MLAFALLKSRNKQGPIDMAGQLGTMWGLCLALLAIVLFREPRPPSRLPGRRGPMYRTDAA